MAAITGRHLGLVKSLLGLGATLFVMAGGWFTLKAEASVAAVTAVEAKTMATDASVGLTALEKRTQRLEDTVPPALDRIEKSQERLEQRIERMLQRQGGR